MKVKELILELQKYDQEYQVRLSLFENDHDENVLSDIFSVGNILFLADATQEELGL